MIFWAPGSADSAPSAYFMDMEAAGNWNLQVLTIWPPQYLTFILFLFQKNNPPGGNALPDLKEPPEVLCKTSKSRTADCLMGRLNEKTSKVLSEASENIEILCPVVILNVKQKPGGVNVVTDALCKYPDSRNLYIVNQMNRR